LPLRNSRASGSVVKECLVQPLLPLKVHFRVATTACRERASLGRKLFKEAQASIRGGYDLSRNPLKLLVGTRGFEPLTPTASR
jgi:hypothetical protein